MRFKVKIDKYGVILCLYLRCCVGQKLIKIRHGETPLALLHGSIKVAVCHSRESGNPKKILKIDKII